MAKDAAVLHGITKQYPGFTLGPIDFTVPTGSIVGLVGENGAGKTTLLKLLTGVNRPTAGVISLFGGSPNARANCAAMGVVFEDSFFYEILTPGQVGKSMAHIFGSCWDAARYGELLRRFGLTEDKKLKESSRGMRLKVQLAAALAHDPKLLVLDEATSGLDPVMRGELLDLFLEFIQDESHSILMSSHITADLQQVADSIAYLHNGRLLFHENKDDLLAEYGLLRCAAADLAKLPASCLIHTRTGSYGSETLVKGRETVRQLLPNAVCDPAGIDDIMRFYSGRDTK